MKRLALFFLFMSIAVYVFFFGVRPYRLSATTGAMAGTFADGDLLFANRLAYLFASPQKGDIVVFAHPEKLSKNNFVRWFQLKVYGSRDIPSRVVAIPGEFVQEQRLKEDEYWLMSDNRDVISRDSRRLGPIPRELITGKIIGNY